MKTTSHTIERGTNRKVGFCWYLPPLISKQPGSPRARGTHQWRSRVGRSSKTEGPWNEYHPTSVQIEIHQLPHERGGDFTRSCKTSRLTPNTSKQAYTCSIPCKLAHFCAHKGVVSSRTTSNWRIVKTLRQRVEGCSRRFRVEGCSACRSHGGGTTFGGHPGHVKRQNRTDAEAEAVATKYL